MAERFKDHFSARAALYATFRPSYPEALGDFLAEVAPARNCALDSACGTGQLTLLLARHFSEVIATDASAEQIANVSPAPNVSYRVARAEASGLADASVDLATVAQAAHWFDLDTFYGEMRRVLCPGGVIALISYGLTEMDGAVGAEVDRFYKALGKYWPPERAHVESRYCTLPFPFAEVAAPAIDMKADWTREQLVGYISTWSAVKELDRAEGDAPFQAFAETIGAVWGAPEHRREVRWPLTLRVGTVP